MRHLSLPFEGIKETRRPFSRRSITQLPTGWGEGETLTE